MDSIRNGRDTTSSRSYQPLSAALADRYHIERPLGEGGMAIVYLAHDVKHDRKVALKVLKPELAAVLGADRFVVEIRTTASLQHPHILPLFDSGSADGFLYYVMPYIEGETLREKLTRETQLAIDEAVRITKEVADALDYAHRHGVIHRDIKPENILLHDGRPMVADFGIALAVSAAAGGRMTETGLSLGTPHYMSPEQATAEKEITAKADQYSLGSVLYEMLTGNPPHMGSSAQQIIMKIITAEAEPVTKFRKSVPPHVAEAVARSLEKLPADRFDSAARFAAALSDASFGGGGDSRVVASALGRQGDRGRWRDPVTLGLAALSMLLGVAAVWGWQRAETNERPLGRFEVVIPGASAHGIGYGGVGVSRDGRDIVYQDATEALFHRRRGELEAKPVPGAESANGVFFSPDGTQIGFVTGYPGTLMVLPLTGGVPRAVVRDSAHAFGSDWFDDGNIYYTSARGELMRVAVDGGAPTLLARPDTALGETQLTAPSVLPGGDAAIVTVNSNGPPQIVVFDFRTGQRHPLASGTVARFSAPDRVVFSRASGELFAIPFDPRRRIATGPEAPTGDRMIIPSGGVVVSFALTEAGDLLYVAGTEQEARVVRVDRVGRAQPVDPDWKEVFSGLALSPDGKRLAVSKYVDGRDEVWVKQLDRGPLTRVSFGGLLSYRPSWSPDGRTITFLSDRDGSGNQAVYSISDRGSGEASVVLRTGQGVTDEAEWSRDGRWLVYRVGSGGGRDVYAQKWGTKEPPVPIATSRFEERSPAMSPNGGFVAYVSSESGQPQVYVRPFPDPASAKWQVSTRGGTEPRWSHSGRELFYRSGANELVAVRLAGGAGFSPANETVLFSTAPYRADNMHKLYEVLPNDQGFLFVQSNAGSVGRMIVVQNWRAAVEPRRTR